MPYASVVTSPRFSHYSVTPTESDKPEASGSSTEVELSSDGASDGADLTKAPMWQRSLSPAHWPRLSPRCRSTVDHYEEL